MQEFGRRHISCKLQAAVVAARNSRSWWWRGTPRHARDEPHATGASQLRALAEAVHKGFAISPPSLDLVPDGGQRPPSRPKSSAPKRLHLCIDLDRRHHLTGAVLHSHATSSIYHSCCSVASASPCGGWSRRQWPWGWGWGQKQRRR